MEGGDLNDRDGFFLEKPSDDTGEGSAPFGEVNDTLIPIFLDVHKQARLALGLIIDSVRLMPPVELTSNIITHPTRATVHWMSYGLHSVSTDM